jgi:RimJ/RimL family protein N-acetyltransferase
MRHRTLQISFVPLKSSHLELLHAWLQEEHVKQFWDDGDRTIEQVLNHYFTPRNVESYIIHIEYNAIGYIQLYPIENEHPYAQWRSTEGETAGLDLFIGNRLFLNQGLSVPIIQEFVTILLQNRPLRRIIADPEVGNTRAHAIFSKAGMSKTADHVKNGKGKFHAIYYWDLE